MSTSGHLCDCEEALICARDAAIAAAVELVGGHRTRVEELVDQIDALIPLAKRIKMYARADELSGNPHPFAAGVR